MRTLLHQSWGWDRLITLTVSDEFAHWLQEVKCFGCVRSAQGVQDNVHT